MIFESYDFDKYGVGQFAELVYEIDSLSFNKFFKNKEHVINVLSNRKLWESDINNNQKFTFAILNDDKEFVGICMGAIGFNENYFKNILGSFLILNFMDAIKMSLIYFVDSFVLLHVGQNDFYIADIAISSLYRGKGYGKQSILDLIEMARDKGCDRVVLDVDVNNVGAFRLYESIGFKVYDKKSFKIPFLKKEMKSMEYKLK